MNKKNYFAVFKVGDIWKSKSKNFVSLTVYSYCFLMACFKTFQKTNFAESKVKVYMFEVPVLWPH